MPLSNITTFILIQPNTSLQHGFFANNEVQETRPHHITSYDQNSRILLQINHRIHLYTTNWHFFQTKKKTWHPPNFPLTTATSVSFSRGFLVPPRHPSASRSRGVNPHELPMSPVNVRCFSTVAVVASDTWILLDPFQSRLEGWPPLFCLWQKHSNCLFFSWKWYAFFQKSGIS